MSHWFGVRLGNFVRFVQSLLVPPCMCLATHTLVRMLRDRYFDCPQPTPALSPLRGRRGKTAWYICILEATHTHACVLGDRYCTPPCPHNKCRTCLPLPSMGRGPGWAAGTPRSRARCV